MKDLMIIPLYNLRTGPILKSIPRPSAAKGKNSYLNCVQMNEQGFT